MDDPEWFIIVVPAVDLLDNFILPSSCICCWFCFMTSSWNKDVWNLEQVLYLFRWRRFVDRWSECKHRKHRPFFFVNFFLSPRPFAKTVYTCPVLLFPLHRIPLSLWLTLFVTFTHLQSDVHLHLSRKAVYYDQLSVVVVLWQQSVFYQVLNG